MSDKHFKLLKKAYLLTDNITPKKFDCGKLCEKACCKNVSSASECSGMLLLPYEKEYLQKFANANYTYTKSGDTDILICSGKCDRNFRPFACRIFPYYANIENDKVSLKKDPRAALVCPLIVSRTHKRPSVYFIRNIKKAVNLLISDDEYKNDFSDMSDFVDSLYELYSKIK